MEARENKSKPLILWLLCETATGTTTLRELGITVRDEAELVWGFITERNQDSPLTVRSIDAQTNNLLLLISVD